MKYIEKLFYIILSCLLLSFTALNGASPTVSMWVEPSEPVPVGTDVKYNFIVSDLDGDLDRNSVQVFTGPTINGPWNEINDQSAVSFDSEDSSKWSLSVSGSATSSMIFLRTVASDDQGNNIDFIECVEVFTPKESLDLTFKGKVTAEDGTAGDNLGGSVLFDLVTYVEVGTSTSVSGDTMVIGAPGENENAGSAYVFIKNEDGLWEEEQKLIAPKTNFKDSFGASVSISGDMMVIGAPGENKNAGSVYVFVKNEDGLWEEEQKLIAPKTNLKDNFGARVSISANTVVVGAPGENENAGSAYVFVRNKKIWSEPVKLVPENGGAPNHLFGASVGVSSGTVIIGALKEDGKGSVYVFTGSGASWKEQQKLTARDGRQNDRFGVSVSISGHTIVIGANADVPNSDSQGSAYVFVKNDDGSWEEQQKLTAKDPLLNDRFGSSVSFSGDIAVIGAYLHEHNVQTSSGSAYVFLRDGNQWSQLATLFPENIGAENDHFGMSASISGNTIVIGAPGDDQKGSDSGCIYIYDFVSSK